VLNCDSFSTFKLRLKTHVFYCFLLTARHTILPTPLQPPNGITALYKLGIIIIIIIIIIIKAFQWLEWNEILFIWGVNLNIVAFCALS